MESASDQHSTMVIIKIAKTKPCPPAENTCEASLLIKGNPTLPLYLMCTATVKILLVFRMF